MQAEYKGSSNTVKSLWEEKEYMRAVEQARGDDQKWNFFSMFFEKLELEEEREKGSCCCCCCWIK